MSRLNFDTEPLAFGAQAGANYPLAGQIDDRPVRDVEYARVLAHRMMFLFLRTVVQRHIPTTEIDDARAGSNVSIIKWSF